LPGQSPGKFRGDGALIGSNGIVGFAVEDGVEGGLLGGDDVP
jgi:hypothetical protein